MAEFERPTLTDLINRVTTDLQTRLQLTGAVLRRSVVGALGRVYAGAVHSLYGYLSFLARQLFPDTSEAEYLARQASLYGIARQPATFAAGDVTFTGTDDVVIPEGTTVRRSDGQEYTTDEDVTVAGGTATVAVSTVVPGVVPNSDAGTSLSLISPLTGVQSALVVAAGGIAGGEDAESDDSLRTRLLARMRQPPHGGADFDYEAWALEVAGVTRAWVYPSHMGPGTVGVTFVLDGEDDIIPDSGKVDEVEAYIDALRPVTAELFVFAPTPVALDMTIQLAPNTATVQAAVQAELEDMLSRDAEPGASILLSRLNEAVSIADGETDHVIVTPSANFDCDPGEIAVLGELTFQAIGA